METSQLNSHVHVWQPVANDLNWSCNFSDIKCIDTFVCNAHNQYPVLAEHQHPTQRKFCCHLCTQWLNRFVAFYRRILFSGELFPFSVKSLHTFVYCLFHFPTQLCLEPVRLVWCLAGFCIARRWDMHDIRTAPNEIAVKHWK